MLLVAMRSSSFVTCGSDPRLSRVAGEATTNDNHRIVIFFLPLRVYNREMWNQRRVGRKRKVFLNDTAALRIEIDESTFASVVKSYEVTQGKSDDKVFHFKVMTSSFASESVECWIGLWSWKWMRIDCWSCEFFFLQFSASSFATKVHRENRDNELTHNSQRRQRKLPEGIT